MTERLTNAEHTTPVAIEQPRLSLTWYLDPTTGKPAARWVLKEPEASRQDLPAAEYALAA